MDGQAEIEEVEGGPAEEIEAAAYIAHAGLDLARFLALDDPLEQAVWQQVAKRVLERRGEERQELAQMIRNEIVEAFA